MKRNWLVNSHKPNEILVQILRQEGIHNATVLAAIEKIPREMFVLDEYSDAAYVDTALPIDCQQTISQPYVVARMSEALLVSGAMHKVLEIGTGSGYQAAVLAELADTVYTVERIHTLYEAAKLRLQKLQINNVKLHYGDGYLGWQEFAPYDAIMVTAATRSVPHNLLKQLRDGGRMIIPVGEFFSQQLKLITKAAHGFKEQVLDPVRFVPLLHGVE
jgi:protein-L-isoaspartate(D-aspartate) O-methyltransferase